MKVEDLTTRHRIMILEDVLKKLESGDTDGGLCYKIEHSAFEIFRIFDNANKIIPILTLENAKRVTEVRAGADKGIYWWETFFYYDFKNRIKFVKWMIEQEKLKNNIVEPQTQALNIPVVSRRSEKFSCPLPETKGCDRHKINDEEGRWEFCNTCKREWAR